MIKFNLLDVLDSVIVLISTATDNSAVRLKINKIMLFHS